MKHELVAEMDSFVDTHVRCLPPERRELVLGWLILALQVERAFARADIYSPLDQKFRELLALGEISRCEDAF